MDSVTDAATWGALVCMANLAGITAIIMGIIFSVWMAFRERFSECSSSIRRYLSVCLPYIIIAGLCIVFPLLSIFDILVPVLCLLNVISGTSCAVMSGIFFAVTALICMTCSVGVGYTLVIPKYNQDIHSPTESEIQYIPLSTIKVQKPELPRDPSSNSITSHPNSFPDTSESNSITRDVDSESPCEEGHNSFHMFQQEDTTYMNPCFDNDASDGQAFPRYDNDAFYNEGSSDYLLPVGIDETTITTFQREEVNEQNLQITSTDDLPEYLTHQLPEHMFHLEAAALAKTPGDVDQTCFIFGDAHTLHITNECGTFPLHPFRSCGALDPIIPEDVAQTCFVLGDAHTLPITNEGGTFPLHPFESRGGEQHVECCATLEAPPGVVGSGVTVSVYYAIILDGPFEFPEKWERTSVVLYIDCPDSRFLLERLTVNLHHWAVSSGTSHMCFMKSSHLLQKGQAKFTFQCHANVIPSQPNVASVYLKDHFCLVCVAAQSDVMVTSRYYGILLSDPLKDRVEKFWLCITYAVPSWLQAVAEYYRKKEGSEGCCEIPEYEELQISYGNKVKVDIENQSGLGWTLYVTKEEVRLRDVDNLSRNTSCEEKERAVRFGSYPPSVKFRVTYDTVPSPETHKPITKLARLSSESGDTISLSFMVQEEKVKDPIDINMLSNGHVPGVWTEPPDSSQAYYGKPSKPLTVQNLMPYINDLADEVVLISGWLDMESELEVIKRTQGMITPREQLQQLLKKWLEDTECLNAPHTWEYFVGVVREVRKGHVADRIVEDVFQDSGLPSDPVALEKYVVSKMTDNWYLFGIHLGLPEDTLKVIDDSELKIKNSARCLVMFQHWMEEIGTLENKIAKIEQAMKEVDNVKVTGGEKLEKVSMSENEQGEGASPMSNDAIPAWVEKMADNWLNFGVALGFSEEDLQSIKDSNDNDVARCSAMLYHWLRTGDRREKTHERLFRAAKEATPPVIPSGLSAEPPPYSESKAVDPKVPHFLLEV